ncbi:MAG: hypothetical protein HY688_00930 [Chloroflexi bacterium]|nr:hypothetical protein [Chloroflexota bacterium]
MRRGTKAHPAMLRPVTVRRSAMVVGEVRTYQELIRLAVERMRLLREREMAERGHGSLDGQIHAVERYREELLRRLGVRTQPPGSPTPPAGEAPDPDQKGTQTPRRDANHEVLEMRY